MNEIKHLPRKGVSCGNGGKGGRGGKKSAKGKSVIQAEEGGSGFVASKICTEQEGAGTAKYEGKKIPVCNRSKDPGEPMEV